MSPLEPQKLRLDPDRPYLFKSPLKRATAGLVDRVGSLFFKSGSKADWKSFRRIAVLRLDHLGDVILALPAVQALEKALPQAQVDLIVGPWAKDVAGMAGLRSAPKVFSASWFAREGHGQGRGELAKFLKDGRYDAVIDLRGEFRHILAMVKAGIVCRVGSGRTSLGFLLTHCVSVKTGLHEIERNFEILQEAGIPILGKPGYPRLVPAQEDEKVQREIRNVEGITRPVIAVHATCLASAKRWPKDHWRRLIEQLPSDMDVVMIGTENEKKDMVEIQKDCGRKIFLSAGSLKLPALAAFLKDCRLFIGVDSGPAHIAAAVGTPVLSLYSGTNNAEQWAPRGPFVRVLQKKTPCSPCERTDCPFENECMRSIAVDEVLDNVNEILKKIDRN